MDRGRILAHRGLWEDPQDKNSPEALKRALDSGYGIELDLRDHMGQIVISHDPPKDKCQRFEDFLAQKHPNLSKVFFALNIKSDGIEGKVIELADRFGIAEHSFVFDMSFPSQLIFQRKKEAALSKLMIATRVSEYERPMLYEKAAVVWLDCFDSEWFGKEEIEKHLAAGKTVSIVSPELHGRPHMPGWERYKQFLANKSVLICTDKPRELERFSGV